jgi:hypothetical protein
VGKNFPGHSIDLKISEAISRGKKHKGNGLKTLIYTWSLVRPCPSVLPSNIFSSDFSLNKRLKMVQLIVYILTNIYIYIYIFLIHYTLFSSLRQMAFYFFQIMLSTWMGWPRKKFILWPLEHLHRSSKNS